MADTLISLNFYKDEEECWVKLPPSVINVIFLYIFIALRCVLYLFAVIVINLVEYLSVTQQAHPTQSSESTPWSYLLALALAHCVVIDKVDAIIHFYTNILGRKVYYFKTRVFITLSVISVYHEILYCESISQEVSSFRN